MYGIKAAVRRLEFAPDPKDMEVTDITSGRFVFRPRPDKPIALDQLRRAIVKAGYEIEGTRIEVTGALLEGGRLRAAGTGQVFRLEGDERLRQLRNTAPDTPVTVEGVWKAAGGEEIVVLDAPRTEEKQP